MAWRVVQGLVPTFLLGEGEAGHPLAHGHEGEVVLQHRVVILALQPPQRPEPATHTGSTQPQIKQ